MVLSFDISNRYAIDTDDGNGIDEMALLASCECLQGSNKFLIGIHCSDSCYSIAIHHFVDGVRDSTLFKVCPPNVVQIIDGDLESVGFQPQKLEQMIIFGKCFSDSKFVGSFESKFQSPINEIYCAYENNLLHLQLGLKDGDEYVSNKKDKRL